MANPVRSYPRRYMRLLDRWERFGEWLVNLGWRHIKAARKAKYAVLWGTDEEILARFRERREPRELSDSLPDTTHKGNSGG